MESQSVALILLIVSPAATFVFVYVIMWPLVRKNLPKTTQATKRYRDKQNELVDEMKEISKNYRISIHLKNDFLLNAIKNGAFRDKEDFMRFHKNHKNEINDIYKKYSEDVDEHIHNLLLIFKEDRKKIQKQFLDESGHSETMKVMNMDLKDFFK